MANRRPRESEAHEMSVEMADPAVERLVPHSEESLNSLHQSWEPLSPTVSPPTPSSSGPIDDDDGETRPLLSRQIEERRQGELPAGSVQVQVIADLMVHMRMASRSRLALCGLSCATS